MTISVIGLNHKSANIDIRGKFSFTADSASLLLRRIKKVRDIHEVIVVSTCNRTEIYCESTNGADDIKNWLLAEKENFSLISILADLWFSPITDMVIYDSRITH